MTATLFYDADCGFCRWTIDKFLAWDRKGVLRAVPIQSPEARVALAAIAEERRLESWHLAIGDALHSGGDAVAPLARLLPFGLPVALLAGAMPGITGRVYVWVARHRDRLGKRVGAKACAVDPSKRRS